MNIQINKETGLVLEGGGMRGVFTAGVLDYLLDRKIYFNYCVGVSAGACNGLSYMSRQRGRAKFSNIDMLEKYRYIGMKYLWTQHSILDRDLLYKKFPNEILPFDFEACKRNPATFEMVTVNCRTGNVCYLTERKDDDLITEIAKASSSLPFVCPIVDIKGEPMLDGGIIDSIPLQRSIDMGHKFNIVVTTRNYGYRDNNVDRKIPSFVYRNYPRLRVALSHRHEYYNKQLEMIEDKEREGSIVVIRPKKKMIVDRLESDVNKLTALYIEGYDCAKEVLKDATILL